MPDCLILNDGTIVDQLESGIDYLVGLVVDNILNTISSDLYEPSFGTDIRHLPRHNIEKAELMLKLVTMVDSVELRILQEQSLDPSTPEEMLARIQLLDLFEVTAPIRGFFLRLRVFSMAGDSQDVDTNLNQILKI